MRLRRHPETFMGLALPTRTRTRRSHRRFPSITRRGSLSPTRRTRFTAECCFIQSIATSSETYGLRQFGPARISMVHRMRRSAASRSMARQTPGAAHSLPDSGSTAAPTARERLCHYTPCRRRSPLRRSPGRLPCSLRARSCSAFSRMHGGGRKKRLYNAVERRMASQDVYYQPTNPSGSNSWLSS